jgi:hypothetical protein
MRTSRRLLALSLLLTCVACRPGPDDRQEAGADGAPPAVEVTMVDYAFVTPDTIPSGWVTFRVTNEGEESHHYHLYRLPENKSFEDYRDERLVPRDSILRALDAGTMDSAEAREVYARNVSDWTRSDNMEMKGGMGMLAPGRTGRTTLELEPGEYVMSCAVQTRDGLRHWQLGMVRGVTVSEAATAAAPPEPDVTVRVTGRRLTTEGTLRPRTQTVRFVVDSVPGDVERSVYHAWLARLDADTEATEVARWETRNPAPAEFLGGFWYIPVDQSAYVTVDWTRARYVWEWGYGGEDHSAVEFTVE